MRSDRPLILLSNDDGFDSRGLAALRLELARFAEVVVCAPLRNQSASSHALTLHTVMRLSSVDDATFALDGTPADCVYVALHSNGRIVKRTPDLVVSGVNHGPNLGVDVVYSGTVAAAREGAQRGIPGLAISADVGASYERAAELGAKLAKELCDAAPPRRALLLNVNVPQGFSGDVIATRLGERRYRDEVIYRADPRGREYLWIGGSEVHHDLTEGTDTAAFEAGVASVTPLALELTAGAPSHDEVTRLVSRVLGL